MVVAPEKAIVGTLSPAEICAELVLLERRRVFCIGMQQRIDGGLRSALARALDYHTGLPPAERKAIFARVVILIRTVLTEDALIALTDAERMVGRDWQALIVQTEHSRLGWDDQRKGVEREMAALAAELPVAPWATAIRGFTALGLAVLVGEACGPAAAELGDYRSHQNLCKRLGIGVVDGKRQGNPGQGATADDWTRHGYSPHRRAIVWSFLDDVLLRAQWRNEGGAQGSYGAIYARQVAEYESRGWSHAKRAARRYMAKALIRDLWREWRRCRNEFSTARSATSQDHDGVAVEEREPVGNGSPATAIAKPPVPIIDSPATAAASQDHADVAGVQREMAERDPLAMAGKTASSPAAIPMIDARYELAMALPDVVAIVDNFSPDYPSRTVTNAAEQVVRDLLAADLLDGGSRRLIYRDSRGAWDEILYLPDGSVTGFTVLNAQTLDGALAVVRG